METPNLEELLVGYILQFLGVAFVGWGAVFIVSIFLRSGKTTAPLQICAAAAGALFGLLVRKVKPEVFSRWVWVPTGLYLITVLVSAGLMDAGLLKPEPWLHHGLALSEAWDNFFSTTRCAGSECLDQFLITMPFYSALAYSAAGSMLRVRLVNKETTEPGSEQSA